ncbi:MAG: D-alanyl-D-alanine carboxypeptidase, partial [Clostridiales bacterium]|nr:D-alanyl-D-alanine carboxypeptidase [Clostridiales bacterium]
MKKKIILGILCVSCLLSGCSKKSDILMRYSGSDVKVSTGINTYTRASSADFLSDSLAVVMEDENAMENSDISAAAAFLINDKTQEVIYANNVYERIYPASTTKLLTALVALKYGNLNDIVTVAENDAGITVYGAKLCHFKKGDQATMETFLNCLLVYSGNDAAIAIADHMYGSEEAFVKKMNEEAAFIGATNTHFTNSHGLHNPNHYTTAYDMYLIFKECLKYDEFKKMIHQASYDASIVGADGTTRVEKFENTNMFLLGTRETPEGVTVFGGKTGSTGDAGDCLVLYSEFEDGTGYI